MLNRFFTDESGAVTVDWVVLTAAIVGLGIASIGVVSGGIEDLSTDSSDQMAEYSICTDFIQCAYPVAHANINRSVQMAGMTQSASNRIELILADDDETIIEETQFYRSEADRRDAMRTLLDGYTNDSPTWQDVSDLFGNTHSAARYEHYAKNTPYVTTPADYLELRRAGVAYDDGMASVYESELERRGLTL